MEGGEPVRFVQKLKRIRGFVRMGFDYRKGFIESWHELSNSPAMCLHVFAPAMFS